MPSMTASWLLRMPSSTWVYLASHSGVSPGGIGIGDDRLAGTGFHRGHEALTTA
jgi:hypothetical protein